MLLIQIDRQRNANPQHLVSPIFGYKTDRDTCPDEPPKIRIRPLSDPYTGHVNVVQSGNRLSNILPYPGHAARSWNPDTNDMKRSRQDPRDPPSSTGPTTEGHTSDENGIFPNNIVNHFGARPSPNLTEQFGQLRQVQESDPEIGTLRKKFPHQFRVLHDLVQRLG